MYQSFIRPLLFALSLKDAERAHTITCRIAEFAQASPFLLDAIESLYGVDPQPVTIAGIKFPNRIGLAAGFDKQGRMLPVMEAIGFGHVEVGTVLPRPQVGNDRPRVFRIPEHQAILNRMGFNSDGVSVVAERLAEVYGRVKIPIGISLSKQKETPLEDAYQDYTETWTALRPYAAYGTINVSSPNTQGLRKLQGREYLRDLVLQVVQTEEFMASLDPDGTKPLFVKGANDLTDDELEVSMEAALDGGASGLIFGNTSLSPPVEMLEWRHPGGLGGWSGPHLLEKVLHMTAFARKRTELPIILVGGVSTPDDVRRARDAGADLVQILTSLVYQGPAVVKRLASVKW